LIEETVLMTLFFRKEARFAALRERRIEDGPMLAIGGKR
jgi:hypothetical protein